MPELKDYEIFISHSWAYSDSYEKLVSFFDEYPYFKWSDHSVPKDDPIHTSGKDQDLYDAIERKIIGCSCVIILAGVYSTYSKWIGKEIEIAKKHKKPIIAVEEFGSERASQVVKEAADEVVKWRSTSIIDAIRKYSL